MTGKRDNATQTIGNINLAKDNFQELVPKINTKLTFDREAQEYKTTRNVQANLNIGENQTKSLKELDKLIEHVILNKMNK